MTPLTSPSPSASGALEPVRAWLLAAAHAEAERLVAEATADAERLLAGARAETDVILAEAREQGSAEGSALAAIERARSRRLARRLVLQAERQAYEDLRARSRAAARALRQDPDYPVLRERLTRLALGAAGPGARTSEHPDGGVVAEAPGIRVDCTLDGLAERAIAALGAEVAQLWAP
jgi:vacuolar-type H+-ATPase subunit E/Vma4